MLKMVSNLDRIRQILDILDFSKEPEDFLELTKMQMYQDQVFYSSKG